jgi:hypothetical protein
MSNLCNIFQGGERTALNPHSPPFDEDKASDAEEDPSNKRYHPGGRVTPHNGKEKYEEHSRQNECPAFGSLCHYKRPYAEQECYPDSDEVVRYSHLSKNSRSDMECLRIVDALRSKMFFFNIVGEEILTYCPVMLRWTKASIPMMRKLITVMTVQTLPAWLATPIIPPVPAKSNTTYGITIP